MVAGAPAATASLVAVALVGPGPALPALLLAPLEADAVGVEVELLDVVEPESVAVAAAVADPVLLATRDPPDDDELPCAAGVVADDPALVDGFEPPAEVGFVVGFAVGLGAADEVAVGFGAAGALLVGLGALPEPTFGGLMPGWAPAPKLNPMAVPGFGSQPVTPTWL